MYLKSDRLKYRPYNAFDFKDFSDIFCNDQVMLYISGRGNSSKVAQKKFEDIIAKNTIDDGFFFFKVSLRDGTPIGFAKIVFFEGEGVEIGYAILPQFWRQGYTSEMIGFMKKYCLENHPKLTVMAVVNTQNVASIQALEKATFKIYKKDVFRDDYCWFLRFIPTH
ncbi:MAG: GNAT family N-acetyltransferase [Flavobacteriaceae bacterium]|nr:GNAT family N-acetyltransferase [Flavobacteriaceae bacterium]